MIDRGRRWVMRNARTNTCILGNERLYLSVTKTKKVFSQNLDLPTNDTRSQRNTCLAL